MRIWRPALPNWWSWSWAIHLRSIYLNQHLTIQPTLHWVGKWWVLMRVWRPALPNLWSWSWEKHLRSLYLNQHLTLQPTLHWVGKWWALMRVWRPALPNWWRLHHPHGSTSSIANGQCAPLTATCSSSCKVRQIWFLQFGSHFELHDAYCNVYDTVFYMLLIMH